MSARREKMPVVTVRQRQALVAAQSALHGRDPVLDQLVAQHGPAQLRGPAPASTRFTALAESIAYQQLNGKAAATIWGRVRTAAGGDVTPDAVLRLGPEPLRAAGLSGSKTRSMLDLADHVATGDLALGRIGSLSDDAVIESLTRVWGIGRWSAQMFLMFTLGRLDVWPMGDYGVRAGFAKAWRLGDHPKEAAMAELGEPFSGARSLVAWYCWRVADSPDGRS